MVLQPGGTGHRPRPASVSGIAQIRLEGTVALGRVLDGDRREVDVAGMRQGSDPVARNASDRYTTGVMYFRASRQASMA